MPLPAPILMPNPLPVRAKNFNLNFNQLVSPAGLGFSQTIERGPTLWVASYDTPPLRPDRENIFRAFLDSLEGSMGRFLGFDPRRPRPFAYRNIGGTPWVQSGQTAVIATAGSTSNSTINLGRLATGTILTAGDYLAFKIGFAQYLFRLRANHTVVGNTATVSVTPRPPTFTSATHAVEFIRAPAEMKMIGQFEETDSVESFPVFKFQAVQFINKET